MNEELNQENDEFEDENLPAETAGEEDTDLVSMIRELGKRIGFLEKKLDILLRNSDRPSRPQFGKPFRPFDPSRGPRRDDRGGRREGGPRGDRPFGNRSFGGGESRRDSRGGGFGGGGGGFGGGGFGGGGHRGKRPFRKDRD